MAHFAEINADNIVQRVIVAEQDFINSGTVGDSFNWVQTSFNGNFRKNYAGIGYSYDKVRDAFIAPQPYPSWTLAEPSFKWEPPTPMPTDGLIYKWNEDTLAWEAI